MADTKLHGPRLTGILDDQESQMDNPVATAATCKISTAHTPHGQCPGTAPEFPWEPVTDGEINA